MNNDLISRFDAIAELDHVYGNQDSISMSGSELSREIENIVLGLPSVQQKTGHWIWKRQRRTHNNTVERTVKSIHGVESKEPIIIHDEWTENVNYCSVCGKRGDDTFFNYCPNCGAKMEVN